MKTISAVLALTSALMLTAFGVYSCSKKQSTTTNESSINQTAKTNESVNARQFVNGASITLECDGNCDGSNTSCSLQGVGLNISCSCSGCKMKVTSTDMQGNTTITYLINATYQVSYLKVFNAFMQSTYPNQLYTISQVEIGTQGDNVVEWYAYTLANGTQGTILYAGKQVSGGTKTVTEIDCTGTCTCREQYNMGTGQASCSCGDCKMTVTTKTVPD
jgi:hypothetical protein